MSAKIKILHLEDNIYDAELVERILITSGLDAEIKVVKKEDEFIEAIENNSYDLIISDHTLIGFTGTDALRILTERKSDTPFIFVSGTLGEEVAISSLTQGATDYVLKHKMERLPSAVKRALKESEEKKKLKWAEDELKRNEEQYRLLTENASDLISKLTLNGDFIFATKASYSLLGIESLTGESIFSFIHPDETEKVKSVFKNISGKEKQTLEFRLRHKSRAYIWCEVSFRFLKDDDNRTEIIAVIRDISERKKYEEEILKARSKEEEMSKLKSNFLSNLSHEFRTPLNGIIGFAEILKSETNNEDHRDYAGRIYRSGKRLLTTLSSILNLSALENNIPETNLINVELNNFVETVYDYFKDSDVNKNLRFEISQDREDVNVFIDKMLLEQSLINILDNAFKFTIEGNISIEIKQVHKSGRQYGAVIIRDTGIGIPQNNFSDIFEDFKQISEGYSRKYEGLGLGLPVAKRMIELIDGKIEFESKVGKGTTFYIYLPLSAPKDLLVNDVHNVSRQSGLTKHAQNKILYVEDNEINYFLMKKFLKDMFIVENASTGEEAIEKIKQEDYTLILMDINLGIGINGVETLKRIRKNNKHKETRVAAVTGYALPSDREKLLNNGFNELITKPFTKQEILSFINQAISN